MKPSLLSLFLVGAALIAIPAPTAVADDSAASGQTAPSSGAANAAEGGAPAGAQGERFERLKQALAELNLTDAQKDQIKQIRASVTDRKERRQQIIAVLTPDQKAKLRELIQAHRSQTPSGAGTSSTPNAN